MQRLGASIQEAGTDEDDGNEKLTDWRRIVYVGLAGIFFFAGIGSQMLTSSLDSITIALFITGTAICAIPIMKAAIVSSFIRRTIDIHVRF